mgnify:CR=1 FL=1
MIAKTVGAEQDRVRHTLTDGMRPAQREAIIAAAVANANAAPIQVTPEVTRRLSELLGVALELPVDDD